MYMGTHNLGTIAAIISEDHTQAFVLVLVPSLRLVADRASETA